MEVSILIVLLGLGFAYFATQNMAAVVVNIANYSFYVPLYLVVIASMLVGLLFSLILSLFENISASLVIWGKEGTIKREQKEIAELSKHVHQLERENTELKSKRSRPNPAIRSV